MRLHCFFSDQTEQRMSQRQRCRPDKKTYDAERLNASQQRKSEWWKTIRRLRSFTQSISQDSTIRSLSPSQIRI
jgi:hypothetical protein